MHFKVRCRCCGGGGSVCYCIMNIGRFSLQNVGLFEMKMLIKLCKLYLMAAYNEIFDGIAEFPPFSDGAVLVAWKQIPDTHKLSKYLENHPRRLHR